VTALLRMHWLRHRHALLALAVGLFAFQWLFTRLAPGPEQAQLMQQLFDLLPAPMRTLFGDEISSLLSPVGFIAFGYSHPFTLALLSAWTIRVPSGALAGEIGLGTMDLLATRGVRRPVIVAAALLVTLAGLAVLLAVALAGTAVGLTSRPVAGVDALTFFRVVATCGLVFAAFGAIALAISATRRTSGAAIAIATALVAGSFALDYVARAWAPLDWARPLSLFSYYSRAGLLQTPLPMGDLVVLTAVAGLAATAAFLIFGRRDL
jgi:ABC-type transport system involved in multi-copper enzyme maturation permease subunit